MSFSHRLRLQGRTLTQNEYYIGCNDVFLQVVRFPNFNGTREVVGRL